MSDKNDEIDWQNEEQSDYIDINSLTMEYAPRTHNIPPSIVSFSNRSSSISSLDNLLNFSRSGPFEDFETKGKSKSWDNTLSSPLDDLNIIEDNATNEIKSKIEFDEADVECMLCFRLLYQPVTIICGHTYCKNCILASVKRNTECPLCSRKLCQKKSEFEYSISYILSGLIEKYFKEEYKEREKEEKGIVIDLKETNEPTEIVNVKNAKKGQPRRSNSGWWRDNQSVLLYPCDM